MELLHLTCLPHIKDMTCLLHDGITTFDMSTTHQRHNHLTAGWNCHIWHVYHTSTTWPADSRMELPHLTCLPHIKAITFWQQDGIVTFDMSSTHQRHNLLTTGWNYCIWYVYHTSKTYPSDSRMELLHLTCLPHIKNMIGWQQEGITAFDMFTTSKTWCADSRMELSHLTCLQYIKDMTCWQQDGITAFDMSTTHQRHILLTAGWNYCIWYVYHTSKTWSADSRMELSHLTCLPYIKDISFWQQDGITAFDMSTTHQRHILLTAGWNYCICYVYHTSKTWSADSRMELSHLTCLPHIKDMTFWQQDGIATFDMFTTHQRHDHLKTGWNCHILPHIKDMTIWQQDGITAFARACAINIEDAVIASVQSEGYRILSILINPGRFLMKINKQLIRLGA